MSDETTLLPCPFCSAKPELWADSRRTWGLVQHEDWCLFSSIRKHEIPEEDFAAWNTRAELGSGTLTAERLEKAKACKSSEELAALAAELIAELDKGNEGGRR